MMTVREAAASLGLSDVTVRRAYREGRLVGRRASVGGWSAILIEPRSVERYRRVHLGKRGPVRITCVDCGVPRAKHRHLDHRYRTDPRKEARA